MALIDFLEKLADNMASDKTQRRMEDGYRRGRVSQESYDKYRDAVDNYNSRKKTSDEDY
ncbi:MAG: hypothetical protein IKN96_02685 [Oscillibacter sp.]|nr:hypothetical protein [Oscillibacter sp.]